jgi:5-methylcytosine-specific restriction endonuclease McrA
VIARDHGVCRVCGRPGSGKRIHVHHRRLGVTQERFLITLCPGHHALVHRLKVVDRLLPALVLELWREQHPEASEQLALDFERACDRGHLYLRGWWEIRS